ncbi:MAG: PDZ domain-containing protein [Rickettsiales bacterium]|nr:PDZ domain-containing protein [Rickettsiales bacterium]
MGFKKIFDIKILFALMSFLPSSIIYHPLFATDLFHEDETVQAGLNVFAVSDVFADIYQKLDGMSWGGKTINVAIESVENIHPDAHIAATDERVVLVWRDSIVSNYPRPAAGDWQGFGQITTALIVKLRQLIPEFGRASESAMYQTVVDSLMRGVDENGRYIYSRAAEIDEDGRILTSAGLQGGRDNRGNFRVTGIYKDSPADVGGVKAGDLITKMNGARVADMSEADVASVLSGFNSGTLKLTVLAPGGEKQVVLRRATIVLADADIVHRADADSGAGLLEIVVHKVSNASVSIVNEALAKYPDVTGIVLDLRGAIGDDERAAAKLSGLFIGQVPVMRIVETARAEVEIVPGAGKVADAPIVVLISNTTRGTAEAIAAAFYENNRGVLVGTPTAGSARIATKIDLENGGALELLNKSVKTGRGSIIDGRGIFPLVCLSNIRSNEQQGAFFLNVLNGDFKAQDFNGNMNLTPDAIRKGCPTITSGADEDALSAAVSVQILTDRKIYNKLISE